MKKIQNGSLLLFVILAYLVPVDVLYRFPQFIPFVEFMADWNLQVRRVGEFSGPASQVNMFVYSVAWCLILIPWVCELLDTIHSNKKTKHDLFEGPVLTVIFLLVIAPFAAWFFSAWPGANWPIDSRFGRVIFVYDLTRPFFSVSMIYVVVWFFLGYALFLHALFVKLFRLRGIKNGRFDGEDSIALSRH